MCSAAGDGPGHLGQFGLGFALGGKAGVELLPALKTVFERALAAGAALEATVFRPVALAAGRAALQGLETQVHGELPGGAFLYVTAHPCRRSSNLPSPGRKCREQFITAPEAVESKSTSDPWVGPQQTRAAPRTLPGETSAGGSGGP